MTIQAVILAGGLGTRLRPLTLDRPKPVVPLLNVPFLCYQLGLLGAHGVRDVILSVSHRAEAIRATMDQQRLGDVRLREVVEKDPLGTAGGVRNAADLVEGRVVVLNGDILTDLDLSAMLAAHESSGAAATIYLTPVENPTAYGLVELEGDGRVRRFLEKPGWDEVTTNTINGGVYVLERELLELIPKASPTRWSASSSRCSSSAVCRSTASSRRATGSTSAPRRSTSRPSRISWRGGSGATSSRPGARVPRDGSIPRRRWPLRRGSRAR